MTWNHVRLNSLDDRSMSGAMSVEMIVYRSRAPIIWAVKFRAATYDIQVALRKIDKNGMFCIDLYFMLYIVNWFDHMSSRQS